MENYTFGVGEWSITGVAGSRVCTMESLLERPAVDPKRARWNSKISQIGYLKRTGVAENEMEIDTLVGSTGSRPEVRCGTRSERAPPAERPASPTWARPRRSTPASFTRRSIRQTTPPTTRDSRPALFRKCNDDIYIEGLLTTRTRAGPAASVIMIIARFGNVRVGRGAPDRWGPG